MTTIVYIEPVKPAISQAAMKADLEAFLRLRGYRVIATGRPRPLSPPASAAAFEALAEQHRP